MITLVLLVVLAAVAAMLYREGLWRSLLMFFNVLAAATFATGWFAPLAALLEEQFADYAHLVDFLSIWVLFCVVVGLLRELSDRIAPTDIAFPPLVERIGAGVVALLTGWVMMAFTAATLHTAPVERDLVQPTPEARMFLGLAPDRKWLQWVRGSSLSGPFSQPEQPFDAKADFILRYADLRVKLEEKEGLRPVAK
ncbi:MAG: hypothetical protein EBX36_00875 [Planctomycetia bacterium]|nr:hypothetical protein [Planctomycetia bacterium]